MTEKWRERKEWTNNGINMRELSDFQSHNTTPVFPREWMSANLSLGNYLLISESDNNSLSTTASDLKILTWTFSAKSGKKSSTVWTCTERKNRQIKDEYEPRIGLSIPQYNN